MLLQRQNEKFADDILTGGIWGLIKDKRDKRGKKSPKNGKLSKRVEKI